MPIYHPLHHAYRTCITIVIHCSHHLLLQGTVLMVPWGFRMGPVCLSGRVELCLNNAWGTICDQGFDTADATVICRARGLPTRVRKREGPQWVVWPLFSLAQMPLHSEVLHLAGIGPIFMEFLACGGSETSILSCTSYLQHTCDHSRGCGGYMPR